MKNWLLIVASAIAAAGCAAHTPAVGFGANANFTRKSDVRTARDGWYLMQPPAHHGDVNTHAQLADWQSIAFFNRASQCDAARARGLAAYGSEVPVVSAGAIDSVQLSRQLASSSLCVSADDPRINWFHIVWK